jgi:hypothetical protein
MLVDARWQPPEPEPEGPSFPWPMLRYPALTVALLVGTHVAPPLIAYVCLIAALYCAVESFALLLPRGDGMRQHKQ